MTVPALRPTSREVLDFYGRRYRVGESDRDLLGRSRRIMLWAAWAAMLAASIGEYGYGALIPALSDAHGWAPQQGFWVLAVWALCQSLTVYPVAKLRIRWGLPPAATMSVGAVLCATGLVSLGGSGSLTVVLVDHGVLGGIGAGLIYGTALSVVAKWYPERPARMAFVSGAFAYGSVPFILLAGQFSGSVGTFVGLTGLVVLAVAGGVAVVLKDPPANWWPGHVDPRAWALDGTVNAGLRNNRPAVRRYSPAELVKSPAFVLLYAAVLCAAAVALFDVAYLAVFSVRSGWGAGFAAMAVAIFAAAGGVIRSLAGRAGERFGRRRVARTALVVGGIAHLLLPLAAERASGAVLLAGCCLAGASVGTWYAVLPGLAEAHFGEYPGLPIFGLSYGAKAVGGFLGAGLAAYVAGATGFVVVAVLSVVAAVLLGLLRPPGRLPLLPR